MPQPFNNAVLTKGGASLITRAQAGECKIQFTRIAIGNGSYTDGEKEISVLQEMDTLKSVQNSYALSAVSVYSEYSVKVTALLTNQDPDTLETLVTEGYYINEMGLFAKEADGDEDTEVLYSIAVTSGDNGDFMPPYNGYNAVQIVQEYYATVNNSAEVSINASGAVALKEDMENRLTELANALLKVSYGEDDEEIIFEQAEFVSMGDSQVATDDDVDEALDDTFG